jgi:hypothetical protein
MLVSFFFFSHSDICNGNSFLQLWLLWSYWKQ